MGLFKKDKKDIKNKLEQSYPRNPNYWKHNEHPELSILKWKAKYPSQQDIIDKVDKKLIELITNGRLELDNSCAILNFYQADNSYKVSYGRGVSCYWEQDKKHRNEILRLIIEDELLLYGNANRKLRELKKFGLTDKKIG